MQEVGEDGTSIFDILFYFNYKRTFSQDRLLIDLESLAPSVP